MLCLQGDENSSPSNEGYELSHPPKAYCPKGSLQCSCGRRRRSSNLHSVALYKRRSRNAHIEVVRTGVHTRQIDREIAAERASHAVELMLVEKISKISMIVQRIGHLQVVNADIKASQDQARLGTTRRGRTNQEQ